MLDQPLIDAFDDDAENFFTVYPVAKLIFGGLQKIESTKVIEYNLQCLLINMCAYGRDHWSYVPGAEQQWKTYLKGTGTRTGCIQNALAFAEMAKALGRVAKTLNGNPKVKAEAAKYEAAEGVVFTYADVKPTVDKPTALSSYRMISKAGVADFTGKLGDHRLNGRWNFGDHSVAKVDNLVYDPSFKFYGFPYTPDVMVSTYVEWWVKLEQEEGVLFNHKWVDVAGVKDDLYEYAVPGKPGKGGRPPVPGEGGLTFDRDLSKNSSIV